MLVDVSHAVENGMITYKGLPAPLVCDFLSREQSRSHYAPGTELHIGKIDMVALFCSLPKCRLPNIFEAWTSFVVPDFVSSPCRSRSRTWAHFRYGPSDLWRNLHDCQRIGRSRGNSGGARIGQCLEAHQALPGSIE
jgi:hypothetical protein